jgi:N-acetylmannosamine-6-phosphate 2-epimerase/N-acetylmannosamine kinase
VAAIHAKGKYAMADCSDIEDARQALAAGADFVGSTLSGYAGGPVPEEPDFDLITAMRELTPFVIAEGRLRTTEQSAEALRRGAYSVVVGSAITRTEHATEWFRQAVEAAAVEIAGRDARTLAIDIGGTKILAALVKGGRVEREQTIATPRELGPDAWIEAVAEATQTWRGQFANLGIAVTGLVSNGIWSALNPATLRIPDNFPLIERLQRSFGVSAVAINDAQAAAWAEYRRGAGEGEDMVFLTISTGIGGGVVLNGRPLLGLAGHFGLLRGPSTDRRSPFEDEVSGRWIAAQAAAAGHATDAGGVFAAARAGAAWADEIISASAKKVAVLCEDIQLTFDPKRIVIGGGIGLADGYLDRVRSHLTTTRPPLRPVLAPARLGVHAGVIGAADFASRPI